MKSGSELNHCTLILLWMDLGTHQTPAVTGCVSYNKNHLRMRHFRLLHPPQGPFTAIEEKQKIQRMKNRTKMPDLLLESPIGHPVFKGNSDLEVNISHSSGYLWWLLYKGLTCSTQGALVVSSDGILRILGFKWEVPSSCLIRTRRDTWITWKLLGMTLVIHTWNHCKSFFQLLSLFYFSVRC